MLNSIKC